LQARTNLTIDTWIALGAPFTNNVITVPATNGSQSFYRFTGQ